MPNDSTKFGLYRALVVDNKDPDKKSKVKVWIPSIMGEIDPKSGKGIWAMAANNPIGGRNTEFGNSYAGTSMVPANNSYVLIFFEAGNINRPYYLGSIDLQDSPVLPECQTNNYNQKWVVFKSTEGRCISVSDDPNDSRIEITGKKREMGTPPSGDTDSVYNIDGNQTSILIDERSGQEKILIRTYKGDFLKIDVENQTLECHFKNDIIIKSGKSITLSAEEGINIISHTNINLNADDALNQTAGNGTNAVSSGDYKIQSDNLHLNSGSTANKAISKTFSGVRA